MNFGFENRSISFFLSFLFLSFFLFFFFLSSFLLFFLLGCSYVVPAGETGLRRGLARGEVAGGFSVQSTQWMLDIWSHFSLTTRAISSAVLKVFQLTRMTGMTREMSLRNCS